MCDDWIYNPPAGVVAVVYTIPSLKVCSIINPITRMKALNGLNIFAVPKRHKELIDKIQNPDLKIIAYILLYQNEKLDDISKDIAEIKDLMESEVWNR